MFQKEKISPISTASTSIANSLNASISSSADAMATATTLRNWTTVRNDVVPRRRRQCRSVCRRLLIHRPASRPSHRPSHRRFASRAPPAHHCCYHHRTVRPTLPTCRAIGVIIPSLYAIIPESSKNLFSPKFQSGGAECTGQFNRFFWNGQTCETFVYTGCGGNGNNFATKEECANACGRMFVHFYSHIFVVFL